MLLTGISFADMSGEIYASLLVMFVVFLICLAIFIKVKTSNPLKRPKGFLLLAEMGITFVDNMVDKNMGKHMRAFAPYIVTLCLYIFLCFIIGLTGIPTPVANYVVPLSLAALTFILIHATSVYYKKMRYFKRYIDPFFFFFPINLISMWAPLLSLSFRMFGNAIAGWVLTSILYAALESLSSAIFGMPYFIAPIIMPALHMYFDVFTGFIQTTVFVMITMLSISAEGPKPAEIAFMEQRRVEKLN